MFSCGLPLAVSPRSDPLMNANPTSYVCGTSKVPLPGETIGQSLDRAAAQWPDHVALISRSHGTAWTWAEFAARVDALAAAKAGLILVTLDPDLSQKRNRICVEDRAQQGAALCGVCRRIPDDGHGQDSEIHHARRCRETLGPRAGEDGLRPPPNCQRPTSWQSCPASGCRNPLHHGAHATGLMVRPSRG